MTQEDKELLLKDLCARLPYGVRYKGDCGWPINPYQHTTSLCNILNAEEPLVYLRPMSSMTEEEKYEYRHLLGAQLNSEGESILFVYIEDLDVVVDWLNKNHFDYRGLIERGLAIEVTEENNSYKK